MKYLQLLKDWDDGIQHFQTSEKLGGRILKMCREAVYCDVMGRYLRDAVASH